MTELYDEDGNWISKTQRKKECDEMQTLGEKIIALGKDELAQMHMEDELRHAIEEAQRMKSNGALKRQRQFIGKLIRNMNAESLQTQLDKILHKHDLHNAEFKRMEKWRDNMIKEGDDGLNAFMQHYPHADRQYLRQLIRNVDREKKNNKPPVAYRAIFKYIREVAEQADNNDESGLYS
jgi:ribosome-associated protein